MIQPLSAPGYYVGLGTLVSSWHWPRTKEATRRISFVPVPRSDLHLSRCHSGPGRGGSL